MTIVKKIMLLFHIIFENKRRQKNWLNVFFFNFLKKLIRKI